MNPKSIIPALTAALALAGCNLESAGSGSLSLDITDAPVDSADEVMVTFNGVELHSAGGSTVEINYDQPREIDLLALQGGDTQPLLEDEALAAGDYQWIRLDVSAESDGTWASYIQINGERHELTIPSGDETGLKLVQGFTVPVNGEVSFTIDFDLRKSVIEDDTGYKLRPALRLVDNTEVGQIAGTADENDENESCVVYVFEGQDVTPDDVDGQDAEPVTTAAAETLEDGTSGYTAAFLTEGDYTAAQTCEAGHDDPNADDTDTDTDPVTFSTAQNVTVQANQTATADF